MYNIQYWRSLFPSSEENGVQEPCIILLTLPRGTPDKKELANQCCTPVAS